MIWILGLLALCGTERWDVKTLKDHPVLNKPIAMSVANLRALKVPATLNTRTFFEKHVVTVDSEIVGYKLEADSDYHIVIQTAG